MQQEQNMFSMLQMFWEVQLLNTATWEKEVCIDK